MLGSPRRPSQPMLDGVLFRDARYVALSLGLREGKRGGAGKRGRSGKGGASNAAE